METAITPAVLNMLLTYEELLLVLRLVNAATLPGLRVPQAEPLTNQQYAQGLVYAERSLRARELARITPDGNFVVHAALLSAVGVCAYADQALIVQHMRPDQSVVELYGSQKDDAVVSYTLPELGLYRFSVLEHSAALVHDVLHACDCSSVTATRHNPIIVADDVLKQARVLAEQGLGGEATELLAVGNNNTSAEALAHTLGAPHSVSIWIVLQRQADDTVEQRELTILHSEDMAWLMTQEADQPGLRTLRPASAEELFDALMLEMNREAALATAC